VQLGGGQQFDLLWGREGQPLTSIPQWTLASRRLTAPWFVMGMMLRLALTAAMWGWAGAWLICAIVTASRIRGALTRLSSRQRRRAPAIVALVACFAGLGVLGAHQNSLTYDETDHYRYGMNILEGNSTRFEDSVMPATALNALPGWAAWRLPAGAAERLRSLPMARLVTVAFSSFVALLVFFWSRALYGFYPALLSLFLYVFDPNIIAHSQLVTTDIYAAGTITFASYCLWRVAHERTKNNALLCAAALGISLLAKYTAVMLIPLFALLLVICGRRALLKRGESQGVRVVWTAGRRYLTWGFIAVATVAAILNIGFLFDRTFTPFADYAFKSGVFTRLQDTLGPAGAVPVPVPYPFLEGLDWVRALERSGASFGHTYLLGELRKGHGFKGYYLVASLLKVPIAIQLVTLAALLTFVISRDRRARFLDDEMFLLLPIAFFVVYFNFFFDAQIGIRYYLVTVPMLYVFAGHLLAGVHRLTAAQTWTAIALATYTVVSVLSYHPSYLAYFNEIVWDRRRAYKYLADSNLDWGQASSRLDEYLAGHPEAIYRPDQPTAGLVVVGGNDLVGILGNRNQFAWLRDHFEPVDTIAYSVFVFDVPARELERYCASSGRC
jgi:4-amino-4-deoxy-L-arabinose transferase-like glycosyltransferase